MAFLIDMTVELSHIQGLASNVSTWGKMKALWEGIMLEISSHLQWPFFPPVLGERTASSIEDQLKLLVFVWGLHIPLNTSVTLTPARCLSPETAWALTVTERTLRIDSTHLGLHRASIHWIGGIAMGLTVIFLTVSFFTDLMSWINVS